MKASLEVQVREVPWSELALNIQAAPALLQLNDVILIPLS